MIMMILSKRYSHVATALVANGPPTGCRFFLCRHQTPYSTHTVVHRAPSSTLLIDSFFSSSCFFPVEREYILYGLVLVVEKELYSSKERGKKRMERERD